MCGLWGNIDNALRFLLLLLLFKKKGHQAYSESSAVLSVREAKVLKGREKERERGGWEIMNLLFCCLTLLWDMCVFSATGNNLNFAFAPAEKSIWNCIVKLFKSSYKWIVLLTKYSIPTRTVSRRGWMRLNAYWCVSILQYTVFPFAENQTHFLTSSSSSHCLAVNFLALHIYRHGDSFLELHHHNYK